MKSWISGLRTALLSADILDGPGGTQRIEREKPQRSVGPRMFADPTAAVLNAGRARDVSNAKIGTYSNNSMVVDNENTDLGQSVTAINRTVTTAEEVAALANEPEGETVDYKGTVDPKEWWELAKDIAAFANHLGGVVLIGAFEGGDGLPELRGLPGEQVEALARAYEYVARDRCRPSPLVACAKIPWDSGLEILAVNVQAFIGLVGAQFYTSLRDKKNPDGPLVSSPANAWQFPMRVGKHNVPLPLEQAIMHMIPTIRRTIILLEGIPKEEIKIGIDGGQRANPGWCELLKIDAYGNVAVFLERPDRSNNRELHIALDDIERIWRSNDGWRIRLTPGARV